MKRTIVIILFTAGTVLLQGFSKKKKVAYEFPPQMLEEVKTEFIKLCDKGQALYEMNCAQCHNLTEKGKEIIPDFLPEQLIGYELRVKNPKHESELPDTQVTAEELGLIMTFLTYKKKSNMPFIKPAQ